MNKIAFIILIFTISCFQNSTVKNKKEIQQTKLKNKNFSKIDTFPTLTQKIDTFNYSIKSKNNTLLFSQFIPDSTINNKLILEDYLSLSKFYPNILEIKTINNIRECPIVIFALKNKLQYLIAYHYEGETINSFNCFEIGYFKNEKKLENKSYFYIQDDSFKTESNLFLGNSLKDLESIKGKNYLKNNLEDLEIITYRISDFDSSPFLKRYNMPSYFMEFTLKNDKIIKIKFGFDYP